MWATPAFLFVQMLPETVTSWLTRQRHCKRLLWDVLSVSMWTRPRATGANTLYLTHSKQSLHTDSERGGKRLFFLGGQWQIRQIKEALSEFRSFRGNEHKGTSCVKLSLFFKAYWATKAKICSFTVLIKIIIIAVERNNGPEVSTIDTITGDVLWHQVHWGHTNFS